MGQLQTCNSPADILAVLRTQVQQFEQSTSGDDKLTKWLIPTVNVLYAFSGALGEGVGLVFSPAKVIFAGAGVLLLVVIVLDHPYSDCSDTERTQAAKDVAASQDALVDIFERIESFFRRLEEYSEVPTTEAMKDTIVKIMVEVLGIFGIVTKEMKQGRTSESIRDDALPVADRDSERYLKKLIGRRDVEDALVRLDRLTQQELQMAIVQVLKVAHDVKAGVKTVGEQVQGVDDKVNLAVEDGKVVKVTTMETRALLQQTASNIDAESRSRVRKDHRAWLSPPDPSTNQNIASTTQHEGTATWFFQGSIFVGWKSKSTTSLLWIHGKPGSGKSILCSAIIQDILVLWEAGLASMAYFYFDFKDTDKQNLRNLLPSLLTQLSTRSDSCCDILSRIYKTHDDGARKPGTNTLIECLKEMLALPGHGPIYIILDALDECPNTSGIPPARRQVLDLINDLVGLQLLNLHICITSRPENDIRAALEPLTFHPVSIHEQSGQKKDIEDYIRSVVYAGSDTAMRRWRDKDKELVIETLTDKADGMFRWVFCQLEVLQHCFPQSIRRTLNELPKSLDETYKRVLKEIGMANRDHAHRLLQCLTAAARPLRVEELAEILALDFDEAEGAIPKLKEDWRWEDRQRAVLSTCSSLITQVDDGDSQACLGTLLQLDGNVDDNPVDDGFPLARYASRHWVEHAQFGKVSSRIEDGMRRLFDSTKPHLSAWLELHRHRRSLVLASEIHPADRRSPCIMLRCVDFMTWRRKSSSSIPSKSKLATDNHLTPILRAAECGHLEVVRMLLGHRARIDAADNKGHTPLHRASNNASSDGRLEVVRLLLDSGANAEAKKKNGLTPLHLASSKGNTETVCLLLDRGASADAKDKEGRTPLQVASGETIVQMLTEHGRQLDRVL
ncbi:hypothetical protein EDB85DRAFT_2280101 [Lactarius pseudohatsudake]|nr:hypothetical protein EDB85DRAFT_2280101 [Lactarius pseudohatsudake]